MAKRKTVKKYRKTRCAPVKEKEPGFMVKISEPKLVRKDILESLREVIVFMQSYEQFKHVQDEKVVTISALREMIKDLNNLINKLKTKLPKGKLPALKEVSMKESDDEEMEEAPARVKREFTPRAAPVSNGDLDDLESQLKDIENQLKIMS
ncbi:MAG: hypothetical protein ABIG93_00155 [archaeon]|nr:hypothetical protein [Nanoarchaeota archaeon]